MIFVLWFLYVAACLIFVWLGATFVYWDAHPFAPLAEWTPKKRGQLLVALIFWFVVIPALALFYFKSKPAPRRPAAPTRRDSQ